MHDGNTDESVEVGRVGYEADYGNRNVWNLEFPRLQKDLESLILNRLTLCVVSLSVSTCLSLQIKKTPFQDKNIKSVHLRASVTHFD